jgi:hypothetical protein
MVRQRQSSQCPGKGNQPNNGARESSCFLSIRDQPAGGEANVRHGDSPRPDVANTLMGKLNKGRDILVATSNVRLVALAAALFLFCLDFSHNLLLRPLNPLHDWLH